MDQLLVATDLSPAAARAVVRGHAIARAAGSRLHVICVADSQTDAATVDRARSLLHRRLEELGVEATAEVRSGRPFVEIIRAGRDTGADLVVLGAQGWDATAAHVLGTTAERVVRRGDRPVLIVRRDPADSTYASILVGTDLSDGAAEAFRFARSAFPAAGVTTAHVCTVVGEHMLEQLGVPDDELDALRRTVVEEGRVAHEAWLADRGLEASDALTVSGDPASELVGLARRRADDLIVVGSHGMSGPRFVLLGSVAHKVLRDASTDVLVVRSGSAVPDLDVP